MFSLLGMLGSALAAAGGYAGKEIIGDIYKKQVLDKKQAKKELNIEASKEIEETEETPAPKSRKRKNV